jgi:hypothetical protein
VFKVAYQHISYWQEQNFRGIPFCSSDSPKTWQTKIMKKYTMRYVYSPSSTSGDALMTTIIDDTYDYKDGFCSIEDFAGTGWLGKITIKEPCGAKNIRSNEPINILFVFSEEEEGNSLADNSFMRPSKWHVFAEVPFMPRLKKVTIYKKAILDECEQDYYRSIPLDVDLQKEHIIDALEKAVDVFAKFFTEKGKEFVPDEDFYRDVFYVDVPRIENPEDETNIDNLKIKKECLSKLIDQELYEADRYEAKDCHVFLDGRLHSSYWSKDEAAHELMLLKKADYLRNEDNYPKYFDTLEEAELYRKLVFVNCFLGEGPQAMTSTDNIIRVAKFRHEWVKKYRKNIEKYLEFCD